MNFLEKAKKKKEELKAQYDKVSKDLSSLNFSDKSSENSGPAVTQTPTSSGASELDGRSVDTAPAELDSTNVGGSRAELDGTSAGTGQTPIMTPDTSTSEGTSAATPSTGPVPAATPERQRVKLSLAQRKNVRDVWEESAKLKWEQRLSKALGASWTLDGDAGYLLNVKGDGNAADVDAPGSMIEDYMSSAVMRLEALVKWYGEPAAMEINILAHEHVISLEIDTEVIKEVPPQQYNRADFRDGRLLVLIHRDHLWSNTSNSLEKFHKVILRARSQDDRLRNEVDFVCKRGIREDWEKQIDRVLEETRELLEDPNFNFDPRFPEVWSALDAYAKSKVGKKKTADMVWPETVGSHMWSYFNTFRQKLKSEKFDEDEMQQGAFKESVNKSVAAFRLVEQTTKKDEMVIHDGMLWLQTTPEHFWSGTGTIADNLMDLL